MDNWHTAQCTKPDVAIFPGLDVPACMNCGEICPSDRTDNKHNDELQIPSVGKRSAMQLNWPPSIKYQNYAYRDDPDGSLHKALVSLVDQEWCSQEPNKHRPCSSIIKTAQTPSSQVSKTSYESLDGTKIRVLRLYKGHFGDCLHGDFEIVNLQIQDTQQEKTETVSSEAKKSPASYEAVSYTWAKGNGKRKKDHVIFIGKSWDVLPITENCFDALQNCRLQYKDRRLWVDAICINQVDVRERTHQVGMMREIYSTASCVLIYLETSNDESGSEVSHEPRILSRNPYFSRIWVVQEIASAKQALVLHDRQAMHWDFFHGNLQALSSKRWMRHFGSPRQIDDAHGFLTLLEDTRDCNASDPRDKVFALLGLWKRPLEPDYTLSPQVVYTGLASMLVTDKSWEVVALLLDMATDGWSMLGLPSWVPDWSEKSQWPCQGQWKSNLSLPMKARPRRAGGFRIHRQTGSLSVLAAEIDILAPYLSCGFRSTTSGILTINAGCIQVSVAPDVLSKCEPTDSIFYLSKYGFCLILRKKADPNVYILIGLCGYSCLSDSQHQSVELDDIRYLQEWAWLLSLGEQRFWSELAPLRKAQICWGALRRQRKLETRTTLQRIVRKAHFLKRSRDLVLKERHAMEYYSKDKSRVREFFQRQWMKNYRRWKQADDILAVDFKKCRELTRKLLPGYRSLEPLQGASTQPPLGQSMWLPVTFYWFTIWKGSTQYETTDLYTKYRLLAACASRNIPLPPIHLITDKKSHISLSLGLELENGLRDLQRVAKEHFPQEVPADEEIVVSRNLTASYRLDFTEEEWAILLHWLSKPTSPSYDMLKYGSKMDAPLIWEGGFVTQCQLDEAHSWLDDNFNHQMAALSSSSHSEASLDKFFELVYREQFELLWLFVFPSHLRLIKWLRGYSLDSLGAGFARSFFWRFDRSIGKACQLVGNVPLTHDEIEEQWARFLNWLTQQSFKVPAQEIPSQAYDQRPRLLIEQERGDEYEGDYFLSIIECDGLFIMRNRPEPPHLKSQTFYAEQMLSELIYSEIWRRRLPERVFAFLFDDAENTPQPTKSGCTGLEELFARDQLSICGKPFTQYWRQESKSWKVVEQYISESQWHMSCMKMDLLRGSKEKRDMYEEVVII